MEVWVVRDSKCGSGDDDPGNVLSVFDSYEDANRTLQSLLALQSQAKAIDEQFGRHHYHRDYELEGPFILNAQVNLTQPK